MKGKIRTIYPIRLLPSPHLNASIQSYENKRTSFFFCLCESFNPKTKPQGALTKWNKMVFVVELITLTKPKSEMLEAF